MNPEIQVICTTLLSAYDHGRLEGGPRPQYSNFSGFIEIMRVKGHENEACSNLPKPHKYVKY